MRDMYISSMTACSLELTWCCYLHRSQSRHISDWSGEADIWKKWLWSVCKLLHIVHPCFNGTLEHLRLSILCKCQWMLWVPEEWPLMPFPVALIRYVSQKCFPPMPVRTDTETGVRDKRVHVSETNGYGRPRQTEMGVWQNGYASPRQTETGVWQNRYGPYYSYR